VTADLWSHAFNIELHRERNRAFLTWSSIPLRQSGPDERRVRRYQIEQVVTLDGRSRPGVWCTLRVQLRVGS
jgi:hypothetical protein